MERIGSGMLGRKGLGAVLLAAVLIFGIGTSALCSEKAYAKGSAGVDAITLYEGKWIHASKGWWYQLPNGDYPANQWVWIGDRRYHFDVKGWMSTGWLHEHNAWYYLGADGAMKTGWQKVKGTWYYLKNNGVMQTGRLSVGDETYFLEASGAMRTGWSHEGSVWRYYTSSGRLKIGWQKVGGKWYYLSPNYGNMITGWWQVGSSRYYFNKDGSMRTGWLLFEGDYYYLDGSGKKVTEKWVGNYYLGSTGAMERATWVQNGKYYVDASGKWVPDRKMNVIYAAGSKIYHSAQCASAKKIKRPIDILETQALAKGMTLCKRCETM